MHLAFPWTGVKAILGTRLSGSSQYHATLQTCPSTSSDSCLRTASVALLKVVGEQVFLTEILLTVDSPLRLASNMSVRVWIERCCNHLNVEHLEGYRTEWDTCEVLKAICGEPVCLLVWANSHAENLEQMVPRATLLRSVRTRSDAHSKPAL